MSKVELTRILNQQFNTLIQLLDNKKNGISTDPEKKKLKSFKKKPLLKPPDSQDSIHEFIPDKSIIFTMTSSPPMKWSPKFKSDQYNEEFTLLVKEVFELKEPCQFILEPKYKISRILHRSFFQILKNQGYTPAFVYYWPLENQSSLLKDLSGLKMTAQIELKETTKNDKNETWELHLKPNIDKGVIYGYLVKSGAFLPTIHNQASNLIQNKKLPLILDLDDTLLRAVVFGNNQSSKFFPESKLHLVKHRIAELKDGRKVVLAEKVFEFLDWAQQFFEISICSLGDQNYVEMVVQVLDPKKTRIKGMVYSARGEFYHLSIEKSNVLRMPPKNVKTLFPYLENPGDILLEPIIVDDNVYMWDYEQRDAVIVVKESSLSEVWNVNLFPIVSGVLEDIYNMFFFKLERWNAAVQNPLIKSIEYEIPSVVNCYKEILRKDLGIKISDCA